MFTAKKIILICTILFVSSQFTGYDVQSHYFCVVKERPIKKKNWAEFCVKYFMFSFYLVRTMLISLTIYASQCLKNYFKVLLVFWGDIPKPFRLQVLSYCLISYRARAWNYRIFPDFFKVQFQNGGQSEDSRSKNSNESILFRRNIDQYSLGESA